MREIYCLLAFDSTHDAIRAEELVTPLGAAVMPTLREITASCGISLRVPAQCGMQAADILRQNGMARWRLYRVQEESG